MTHCRRQDKLQKFVVWVIDLGNILLNMYYFSREIYARSIRRLNLMKLIPILPCFKVIGELLVIIYMLHEVFWGFVFLFEKIMLFLYTEYRKIKIG